VKVSALSSRKDNKKVENQNSVTHNTLTCNARIDEAVTCDCGFSDTAASDPVGSDPVASDPAASYGNLSLFKRNLLGIRGLSRKVLLGYLSDAETFIEVNSRAIKKVPTLRGKSVINLFLEPSTRTRTSFELAAKRLSADAINISGSSSSVQKGESLSDTVETLQAMSPDVVVLRHHQSGAAIFVAQHVPGVVVVNAGDGSNEHPTQALLDLLAIKRRLGRVEGLKIAIVGDVLHSRVARSALYAHKLLGNSVRLVGPPTLVPEMFSACELFGTNVSVHHNLFEGIEGVDVVVCLRMQFERQEGNFIASVLEYSRKFCVGEELLTKVAPKSVVLHPGPINRGIEIASQVADGPRAVIKDQVSCGVAVRMAVLLTLMRGVAGGSFEKDFE
jgi:aspartate carbamoyltransferase catalytic subunit